MAKLIRFPLQKHNRIRCWSVLLDFFGSHTILTPYVIFSSIHFLWTLVKDRFAFGFLGMTFVILQLHQLL